MATSLRCRSGGRCLGAARSQARPGHPTRARGHRRIGPPRPARPRPAAAHSLPPALCSHVYAHSPMPPQLQPRCSPGAHAAPAPARTAPTHAAASHQSHRSPGRLDWTTPSLHASACAERRCRSQPDAPAHADARPMPHAPMPAHAHAGRPPAPMHWPAPPAPPTPMPMHIPANYHAAAGRYVRRRAPAPPDQFADFVAASALRERAHGAAQRSRRSRANVARGDAAPSHRSA